MKKNRITSVLQVISILIGIPIIIINLVLLLIAKNNGGYEILLFFLCTCIIFILIIVVAIIMNIIFSRIGKRKIIITKSMITYKGEKYLINSNSRVIYSKVSLSNIISYGCPGDLILIINNKRIKLGWYFKYEIKKMSKYIPIKYESSVDKY